MSSQADSHASMVDETAHDTSIEAIVPLPAEFNPNQSPLQLLAPDQSDIALSPTPFSLEPENRDNIEDAVSLKVFDPDNDDLESLTGDPIPTGTTKEGLEDMEVDVGEGLGDEQNLQDVLRSLQARQEEEAEDDEMGDAKTAVDPDRSPSPVISSPMSPLPGLPSILPLSPTPELLPPLPAVPASPLLPLSETTNAKHTPLTDRAHSNGSSPSGAANGISRESPAESSTNAQRRIPAIPPSTSVKRARSNGKSKQNTEIEDTLESLSEGDTTSNTEGSLATLKKKPKRQKSTRDADGKPIRVSIKSRTLLDQVLGIPRSASNPNLPDKSVRNKAMTDTGIKQLLLGKDRETQLQTCQKPRYAAWGKCTQCISKLGGDTCRFINYRTFKIDPETTDILGPGWFESTELKEDITPLPRVFNVPFQEEHMVRIEKTVAPMLAPVITREIRHVVQKKTITRGVDSARHRSVCDFCALTIFAGYFFCKRCGKDYCLTCERYFSTNLDTIGSSPWNLPDAARPRLLRCVAPAGEKGTGFGVGELGEHWERLAEFVLGEGKGGKGGIEGERERLGLLGLGDVGEDVVLAVRQGRSEDVIDPELQDTTGSTMPSEDMDTLYTKITNPKAMPIPDPAKLEDKSREFMLVKMDELDNARFGRLWSRGEPILVDGVGEKMKMSWGPDDFIERFGHEVCSVVDCTTNVTQSRTVKSFFKAFKDSEDRGGAILKVKDWPTTDDFRNTHPALYNDFCDALPVPDYTRREGVLNLYSHFPPGVTRPDIGPKLYNAFEAVETTGGFGSTRLHMDVADAVNIMLYASPRAPITETVPTSSTDPTTENHLDPAQPVSDPSIQQKAAPEPGCAVWDLYRAEDAPLIRSFLTSKFGNREKFTDPIHSQLFYLDAGLRRQLYERTGVVGWRIYQYPGQAVFIPAGCAHQVCNLADCIKIALDFVSPHNVSRCKELTQDFRAENFVIAWKEDVLQLYNVLWYAWLNCQETRARRQGEARTKVEEDAAREARLISLRNGVDPDAGRTALSASNGSMTLAPVVSSMRDQTPQPELATSAPATPPLRSPLQQPINDALAPLPHDPSETPTPTPRLTQTLLQATLKLEEPAPAPEARTPSAATKWGVGAITRLHPPKVKRQATDDKPNLSSERKMRGDAGVSIGKLIREKQWPLDLAFAAARLQMGQGGDIEEFMRSTEVGEEKMEVDNA